ncbi:DUF6541 family protein [Actinomyces minihominis]|uniref:DUF6541 family protein n=1 Tax=Actinomyces minihominis TaxID=2002838 RepID=UPI000C080A6D|nr:DUF6541 family protein [Actinomyces minihominis]
MSVLVGWIPWIGLAAAMVVTWVGTTYFWLRLARVPAPAAFAASPAVTTALLLPLSLLYYQLGWFWSGARVLPVLALIGALGGALFARRRRVVSVGRPRYRMQFWSLGFAAAAFVGWLLAALPMMLVAPAGNPVQQWDPSFHINGVWGITQLGIATPTAALAHNYGGGLATGYPVGWHIFTALFATPGTTVEATNAVSLALIAVWVVGSAIYAYTLYPSRRVALAAAVIAGVLPSMPADALNAYSQAPNAMSVALLPGGAVIVILLGRSFMSSLRVGTDPRDFRSVTPLRAASWGTTGLLLVVALATVLGGVQSHQVYAFNILLLLLAPLLAGAYRLVVEGVRTRRPWLLGGTIAAFALSVAVFIWVQLRPEVGSLRSYPRSGVGLQTAISQALVPNPPYDLTYGLMAYNFVITVLLILGIIRIVGGRFGQLSWAPWPGGMRPPAWPIWSYLVFITLVFFAYGPDWEIRKWIVGPWFSDGRRIMEAMSVALVPIVAVGFGLLASWCVNWWNLKVSRGTRSQERWISAALGVILLVGTGFGAMDTRINEARGVFDASALGKAGMAEQSVLDLMATLPDLLPEDAVVLGDPQAGVVYAQAIGQRWVYFPQLSLLNEDVETQKVIVKRFGDLNTDPEVCEAINKAGITHYMSRPDGAYFGRLRSDRMPGLYNVNTSVGFELVAEAGDTRLYEITACN